MIIEYEGKKYEVKELKFNQLIREDFRGYALTDFLDSITIYNKDTFINNILSCTYFPEEVYKNLFIANASWFITKGFATEVKKETKLEPGMILYKDTMTMMVTPEYRLFFGRGWEVTDLYYMISGFNLIVTTLESFNQKHSQGNWKIQK